ncbi:hypothetical protein AGLY_015056, partial [Aphis glycines]
MKNKTRIINLGCVLGNNLKYYFKFCFKKEFTIKLYTIRKAESMGRGKLPNNKWIYLNYFQKNEKTQSDGKTGIFTQNQFSTKSIFLYNCNSKTNHYKYLNFHEMFMLALSIHIFFFFFEISIKKIENLIQNLVQVFLNRFKFKFLQKFIYSEVKKFNTKCSISFPSNNYRENSSIISHVMITIYPQTIFNICYDSKSINRRYLKISPHLNSNIKKIVEIMNICKLFCIWLTITIKKVERWPIKKNKHIPVVLIGLHNFMNSVHECTMWVLIQMIKTKATFFFTHDLLYIFEVHSIPSVQQSVTNLTILFIFK